MEVSLWGLLSALAISVRLVRKPVPIVARGVRCKIPNGGLGQAGAGGIELLFVGQSGHWLNARNQAAICRLPAV